MTLPTRAADSEDIAKTAQVAAKLEAAKECNVYVHFSKGRDAHCLYDPLKKNAVPLTVFQRRSTGDVTLNDAVLEEGLVKHWEINGSDFYAIYKNRRVVIVNIDSGQTGLIPLGD